ncbi:Kelch-type beta propeller [Arabidopsis suecica]|uniref:Kelch-type beta propeller n=1 Tax=Arabidopsis suecica TaxID=45249 RepID=A0A8T1ZEQ6_ARASU|nr:Kelch-type beta propeller [Arabidopsis suecica]
MERRGVSSTRELDWSSSRMSQIHQGVTSTRARAGCHGYTKEYYGVYLGLNGTKRSELDQGARLELEQDVTDTPRSELHQGARLELEQDVTELDWNSSSMSWIHQGVSSTRELDDTSSKEARISRSHYPKLSLVCKTFRTLLISNELTVARLHHKTHETFFHVCLKFPDRPNPSMFTLWIRPGQILTNQLEKKERSTGDTRLVQIPSSYYYNVPLNLIRVGSKVYGLRQSNDPSSNMLVRKKKSLCWHKAPNMTVARAKALACVLNGKIYVMGGCGADESANWSEVFDIKTQTWEPLPDPGAELRFSSIRRITVIQGKLYVRSNEKKDSVYDPKEGKWDVTLKSPVQCSIDNVQYYCDKQSCCWYDTNSKKWRVVKGLDMLNWNLRCGMIEIANYDGQLLILWDKFVHRGTCQDKDIWCAVIGLERHNGSDEVWGNIEWADIVLTVPSSYVFINSLLNCV